jgi:hypothetical protein
MLSMWIIFCIFADEFLSKNNNIKNNSKKLFYEKNYSYYCPYHGHVCIG